MQWHVCESKVACGNNMMKAEPPDLLLFNTAYPFQKLSTTNSNTHHQTLKSPKETLLLLIERKFSVKRISRIHTIRFTADFFNLFNYLDNLKPT
nr:hypothetical protein CFP56_33176 [Quercus suber]